MSRRLEADIRAHGTTEVIAFLTTPTAASAGVSVGVAAAVTGAPEAGAMAPDVADAPRSLARYFRGSEAPPESAAASAAISEERSRRGGPGAGLRGADTAATESGPLFFPNLGVMLGRVDEEGLAGLNADPRVAKVTGTPEFTLIHPVQITETTLTEELTWGIRALEVPKLWAEGLTGEGVLVGHLDTGIDGTHPVFAGAISAFAEFNALGRQTTLAPQPFDTGNHGTHTAATIAARPVSGQRVGVAPGAKLASAIVIEGGRVVARILGGMDWAVGQNVRILNMSLGLRGYEDDFLRLTQLLRDRNILPVFAVGNEGPGRSRYPGNYSEALSVGAADEMGQVADFSSSQRFERDVDPLVPDLVAPGVQVVSAGPGGGYLAMNGSSMATPHVSGLAALLMQSKPGATVDEVERAIFTSCRVGGAMDPERCNRGMPNAVAALRALT